MKSFFLSALCCGLLVVTASRASITDPEPLSISADQIEKLLQSDTTIRTADDLLSKLPEDFRQDPVLMYRTQSLQEASTTSPRVILFGKGGRSYENDRDRDRLFLAFNGSPHQKNFQSFELIQYRHQTGTFDFAKIQFSDHQAPAFIKSPPECIRCHDYPGHPNWNPYPFWPGAYPSRDGLYQSGDAERKNYVEFYNNFRTTGRYRHLKFQTPEELEPNTDAPTTRLANIMQDMAEVSMPAQVAKTRNYAAYRHLTAAAMRPCPNLESFVPPELLSRFARTYADTVALTTEEEKKSYVDRVTDLYHLTEVDYPITADDVVNFSLPDMPATAGLRWVMERDGGSISPWFFSFDRKEWAVMRSQFSYMFTFSYSSGLYTAYECDDLKKDSLHDLGELLKNDPNPLSTGLKETTLIGDRNANAAQISDHDVTTAQGILESSCVKCHTHPEVAPVIYFNDLAKLATQLRQPPVGKTSTQPTLYQEWKVRLVDSGERRMPPDHELNRQQIEALTNYLDEILSTTAR